MAENPGPTVGIDELRVGLFVHLDLGWMDHPFPLGSFKIGSQQQIDTIRTLGVKRLRYSPEKSDPPPKLAEPTGVAPLPATPAHATPSNAQAGSEQAQRTAALSEQKQSLQRCEKRFSEGARTFRAVLDEIASQPTAARERSATLVNGMVSQMLTDEETALRLLSEGQGDRSSLHAMNVTVLSLLLGKSMGLEPAQLSDLGLAAFLHDIGKTGLPDRVRHRDESFTAAHFKLYQEHVARGVEMGKRMALPPAVLLTLLQHHEMADGSGFPVGLPSEKITPMARILALINRYDGLCNPPNPIKALTPHEALSLIFATMKPRFESGTLNAFIRMMGVYPPGSLVQLTDGRYAIVVSVNSSRPLKPRVLVHDKGISRSDALILDLQNEAQLGVQRSMKADQLPRSALEFLEPRQRTCYYFERAVCSGECPGSAV
jgi:HD-GYP domain-containing protein (c-di-GMP phosphodiesterase class II)